jgi:hypothetical protein
MLVEGKNTTTEQTSGVIGPPPVTRDGFRKLDDLNRAESLHCLKIGLALGEGRRRAFAIEAERRHMERA